MAKWNIWKKITETISKSKTWLDGQSNAVKVLCAGAMSVIIFVLAYLAAIRNSDSNSVGYWNFIILIVSAPVAFVIWHFRDENNRAIRRIQQKAGYSRFRYIQQTGGRGRFADFRHLQLAAVFSRRLRGKFPFISVQFIKIRLAGDATE